MQLSPSFEQALQAAKSFAQAQNINYVSSDLLCCAVVEHSDEADTFLSPADKEIFLKKLFESVTAQPGMAAAADVPFTYEADIMYRLAAQYMVAFEEETLDLCHYMLAVFSCDTKAAQLLKERGWVLANYLVWLTGRKGISVDFPDQLYPATDYIPRRRKISFTQKLFSKQAKASLAQQYLDDAVQLIGYKDYDRALVALSFAADEAPKNQDYYLIKAHIELKQKRYQDALKTTAEATKKGMGSDKLSIYQADCLYQTGAYQDCIECCNALLATSFSADAHNLIGFALSATGNHQEAITHFDRALLLQPEYAFALNNKGYSLFKLGAIDDAINYVNASLQVDKGNSYAYRNLALIAQHLGELPTAKALAEKAVLFAYRDDYGNDLDHLL